MPASLVVSSFDTPVSVFRIETLTPAATAPEGSFTVPRISPEFVFCAKPTALRNIAEKTNSAVAPKLIDRDLFFIERLLSAVIERGYRKGQTILHGKRHFCRNPLNLPISRDLLPKNNKVHTATKVEALYFLLLRRRYMLYSMDSMIRCNVHRLTRFGRAIRARSQTLN